MITDEQITELNLEDDLIDDITSWETLKEESENNLYLKAKLYFKIFNKLKELKDNFKDSKEIYIYINELKPNEDFEYDFIYSQSDKYGKAIHIRKVEQFVFENRESINSLINLFFRIFKEEE